MDVCQPMTELETTVRFKGDLKEGRDCGLTKVTAGRNRQESGRAIGKLDNARDEDKISFAATFSVAVRPNCRRSRDFRNRLRRRRRRRTG